MPFLKFFRQFSLEKTFDKIWHKRTTFYEPANTNEIGQATLRKIKIKIGFSRASVQLIASGKRFLVAKEGFEYSSVNALHSRPIEEDRLVQKILFKKEIEVISNTSEHPLWGKNNHQTSGVNSWAGIPLIYREKIIGLITLDHYDVNFYTAELFKKLHNFFEQVAGDLYRASFFEGAVQKTKALELVNDVIQAANQTAHNDDFIHSVCRLISAQLQCVCAVYFSNNNKAPTKLSPIQFSQYDTIAHKFDEVRLDIADSKIHDFIKTVFNDKAFVLEDEIIIGVPIKVENQKIGVIVTKHVSREFINESNILLLENIALHTGLVRERNRNFKLFQEIEDKVINSAKTLDVILQEIIKGAIELTNSESGVIYLFNSQGDKIINRFRYPADATHPDPRLDDEQGITRQVIHGKEIIKISNISATEMHVNPKVKDIYNALVAVPMMLDHKVVGVFFVNDIVTHEYSPSDVSYLVTLGNHAASVIEKMNLIDQNRESKDLYRKLLEKVPGYVFRKDKYSKFTYGNDEFCDLLGTSLEELIGKTDSDFFPEAYARDFMRDDDLVIKNGDLLSKPEYFPLVKHKGTQNEAVELLRITVLKIRVFDNNGNPECQGIFWEPGIRERYKNLVEQSPDCIIVHKNRKIQLANESAHKLFGYGKNEMIGKDIFTLITETDRVKAMIRLEKMKAGETVETIDMNIITSEGLPVNVEIYAKPSTIDPEEVQVIMHDLTPVNDLSIEISHRAKNSLDTMKSYLSNLVGTGGNPEMDKAFETMELRIAAMATVHELLSTEKAYEFLTIQRYLEELKKQIFTAHGLNSNTVSCLIKTSDVKVFYKVANLIGQIFTITICNSIKHGFAVKPGIYSKGNIWVTFCNTNNESFYMTIKDDGRGIANNSYTEGVGLNFVKGIVEKKWEGTYSLLDSNGAHFEMRIPVHKGERWFE